MVITEQVRALLTLHGLAAQRFTLHIQVRSGSAMTARGTDWTLRIRPRPVQPPPDDQDSLPLLALGEDLQDLLRGLLPEAWYVSLLVHLPVEALKATGFNYSAFTDVQGTRHYSTRSSSADAEFGWTIALLAEEHA